MFDIAKREGWFQVLKKVAAAQRERRANSSWAGSYFASGLKEAR
jgi:hypothetical protein